MAAAAAVVVVVVEAILKNDPRVEGQQPSAGRGTGHWTAVPSSALLHRVGRCPPQQHGATLDV